MWVLRRVSIDFLSGCVSGFLGYEANLSKVGQFSRFSDPTRVQHRFNTSPSRVQYRFNTGPKWVPHGILQSHINNIHKHSAAPERGGQGHCPPLRTYGEDSVCISLPPQILKTKKIALICD